MGLVPSVFLVLACTPAPAPVAPAPVVTAQGAPEPVGPGPSEPIAPLGATSTLSCSSALPPDPQTPAAAAAPIADTPTAGQMTEEAAQAKRLFDAEHWEQAVLAFDRVISGDTGDDEGNKQLAVYYRAIALHHGARTHEAASAFLAIAAQPKHLKHPETLLWLVKLAQAEPAVVHGFRFYDAQQAARFDNEQQREVYDGALFLLARERFERGAKAEAKALFAKVGASSRWSSLARECLERTQ
jgi:hypothetical protein